MNELVLRGVRPLDRPEQDIHIEGGRIVEVGDRVSASGAQSIDCAGLIALPGLVDLHTHLRQPGKPAAETVASGTLAGARGGFTAVCAMANTQPVADNPEIVDRVRLLGKEAGNCDVFPVGAVTVRLAGSKLADIAGMAAAAAAVRIFSDDGFCVASPQVMRVALRAVRDIGGVLAQHAQEPALTKGAQLNEGAVSRELGLPGWPAVAEEAIIARDCLMAHHEQARLHVCHVSTAGSVEVIRWAKARGMPVTAEVTPHHLLLTDELARTRDPAYKVNPPLRTHEDVAALREALIDGTIDVVATDHAPHTPDAKAADWCDAPMGMLGLETALPLVADLLVAPGALTWADLAERMSVLPARIAGIGNEHGQPITAGAPATLCLIDPTDPWPVEPEHLASLSRNTPYAGHTFTTRVVATLLRGRFTHDRLHLQRRP